MNEDSLPKTQKELLQAMRSGVAVHRVVGRGAFYFRDDNMKTCTQAAIALIKKGFAKSGGAFGTRLIPVEET